MKALKIAVYAIAKDEQANVEAFLESCQGADAIYVGVNRGDTTGNLLEKFGANVVWIDDIPFRFDQYRNIVLNELPHDIDVCVSLDLDERLEPGWRKKIEKVWKPNTTKLNYWLQWSDSRKFYYDRIHARANYRWRHANHEGVYATPGTPEFSVQSDLTVYHHRDAGKDRKKNLPLLELAVKEDPNDARMLWYLGREYYQDERYDDAIKTFKDYLNVGTWGHERCWACIYIARSFHDAHDREAYLRMAIAEAPDLRDPYVELCSAQQARKNLKRALDTINAAIKIHTGRNSFFDNNGSYTAKPYLLKAQILNALGRRAEELECYRRVLRIEPNNAVALGAIE